MASLIGQLTKIDWAEGGFRGNWMPERNSHVTANVGYDRRYHGRTSRLNGVKDAGMISSKEHQQWRFPYWSLPITIKFQAPAAHWVICSLRSSIKWCMSSTDGSIILCSWISGFSFILKIIEVFSTSVCRKCRSTGCHGNSLFPQLVHPKSYHARYIYITGNAIWTIQTGISTPKTIQLIMNLFECTCIENSSVHNVCMQSIPTYIWSFPTCLNLPFYQLFFSIGCPSILNIHVFHLTWSYYHLVGWMFVLTICQCLTSCAMICIDPMRMYHKVCM